LNRRVLRLSAILGAAAVSTLAVAPAFAATNVSSASAQALQLSIANNSVVSQIRTATNDGSTETSNNASTLPDLVSLIPGNNALKAGVAVQQAKANPDGTSYACAGLAGTGGGLVTVGQESCNLRGGPLTLDLGSLDLDLTNLLGGNGAITSALNGVLGGPLSAITGALTSVVNPLTTALGQALTVKLSGGLSVVEASCTANPEAAQGKAEILDTSGDKTIPITLTLGNQTINLLTVDTSVAAKPGGTDVLVKLDTVTAALFQAIQDEITNVVQGQLAAVSDSVIKPITDALQGQVITALVQALQPVLQAVSDNLLKITVNDVTPGDGGKSVKATALSVKVLGAAAPFLDGAGLVDVTVGKVSCGPNEKVTSTPETNPTPTTPEDTPDIPTVVDSGVAGNGDNSARTIIAATAALMLLAGTAGLVGYRRMLSK